MIPSLLTKATEDDELTPDDFQKQYEKELEMGRLIESERIERGFKRSLARVRILSERATLQPVESDCHNAYAK